MNDQARDSEPPEEPYFTSEQALLSPASPKPMQFPQPTNIPILEKMMDVGFNQTGAHMGDPSTRDTEVRPNAWRDPNEQNNNNSATDYASPYSTGGEANDSTMEVEGAHKTDPSHIQVATHSNETAPNGDAQPDSIQPFNAVSHEVNSYVLAQVASDANAMEAPQPSSDPSVPTAKQHPTTDAIPTQSNEVTLDQSQPTPVPGAVDVQALLDTLQTSLAPSTATSVAPAAEPAADGITVATTLSTSYSQAQPPIPGAESTSPLSAAALGAPPVGLPPRPPPQEQPLINPNYVHSHSLRDYHPHATHPAVQSHTRSGSSGNVDQSSGFNTATQEPHVFPTGQSAQAAVVDQSMSNQSNNHFSAANTPIESRREYRIAAGQIPNAEDQPWTQDIQRKYDRFMEEERRYVNEARWDQFPMGSRLFVGNLSSEKVTKRDIFHVFHNYGELAQISIKQAYGFVQFLKVEDCQRALEQEQGRQIRDKRIHLEVSKPQKNGRQQQNNNRRSRSPEYGTRGKPGGTVDRYVSGGRGSNGRGRDGGRDGYRSGYRSPSPRGYRDRYDERYRTRSRSPGYGRDRYRGASPRRDAEDDLPLPPRQARDVPDVQIIVLDPLERDFIAWVEKAYLSRGVRVDVLHLSPRLNEEAVVNRQIMEGVLAVSKLKMANQTSSKVGLRIFKRRGAQHEVQFEDYNNLEPHVCGELVLREKQRLSGADAFGAHAGHYGAPVPLQPPQAQYSYQQPPLPAPFGPPSGYPPGYGQPPAYAQPGAHPGAPQSQMDPNDLQNLLSTLNQTSQQPAQYGTPAQQHPAVGYPPPAQQQQQYGGQQYTPAMGAPGQQHPQQAGMPPAGGQPNMQDILAKLGSYRQP